MNRSRAGRPSSSLLLDRPQVAVVDTDALLTSVDNHARRGLPSRIFRMSATGTFRLFASDHVLDEALEKLPRIARSSPMSESQLHTCLEDNYLNRIRFVSVPKDVFADEQTAAVTHEADVPTAVLAKLVAPCLLLSGDKHLRNPGLAPQQWREAAGAGVAIAQTQAAATTVTMVSYGVSAGALSGVQALARTLKASPFLISFVFVGLGYLFFTDSNAGRRLRVRMRPVFSTLASNLLEAYDKGLAGEKELRREMVDAPADAEIEVVLAAVLARAKRPLLAREIKELLEQDMRDVPTSSEIREELRRWPMFENTSAHRWQLGRVTQRAFA